MKLTAYDAILFDLDGTLTDAGTGITKSIQYALSRFGIREQNLGLLVSFIGAPIFDSLRKRYSLDEPEARRAVEFYREYYSDFGIYENAVYPGIPELLGELREKGKKLVVATLKPVVFAERVLNHFGLADYFDLVAGSGLDAAGLSKTQIIQQALSKLTDVSKEKVVMVGDRGHDVIGARKNGIDSIAVTYGYGTLEELQNANPMHIADSVESLKTLLC